MTSQVEIKRENSKFQTLAFKKIGFLFYLDILASNKPTRDNDLARLSKPTNKILKTEKTSSSIKLSR